MVTFKFPFGFHAVDSSPSQPPAVSSDIGEVLDLLAAHENSENEAVPTSSCASADDGEPESERQDEFLPEPALAGAL